MTAFLRAFAGIAVLRLDPSALPASLVLLLLAAAAYWASSAFAASLLFTDGHWLGRANVDLASTLVPVWLLLSARGRGHRWRQTMSAILGTAVLLSPLGIALQWLLYGAGTPALIKVFTSVGVLAVVAWSMLIVAHVLRSAIDVGYLSSIALSLAYLFLNWLFLSWAYPVQAA